LKELKYIQCVIRLFQKMSLVEGQTHNLTMQDNNVYSNLPLYSIIKSHLATLILVRQTGHFSNAQDLDSWKTMLIKPYNLEICMVDLPRNC